MNALEKILSSTLLIILMTPVRVHGKPCSNSGSECQQVRMPLVSNKLNAPLVAELDVTAMNHQLATYIRDDIESTFSKDIKTLVKKEQDDIKVSILQDYSSKLNKTKKEYDKHISKIVQSLEEKQSKLQLEISDVNKNISESESTFNTEITNLLNEFEQRQKTLKVAMLADYLSKLQQSQDESNQTINDIARDLHSQFDNFTKTFKEEFIKSMKTQRQELQESFKKTLNEAYVLKHKDCSYMRRGKLKLSGVYTIYPNDLLETQVYCDMITDGGGWTVIQRRIDGTTSFDRNWDDYREGFGDPQKEYWLGNKYLNILTTNGKYELRIDLTDSNNKMTYALYKTFSIGDEDSKYKLTIGGYSGTADNWMERSNGNKFSTKDRDHDAFIYGRCTNGRGAWWHGDCGLVFLNLDMTKRQLYWYRSEYIKSTMMIRHIM